MWATYALVLAFALGAPCGRARGLFEQILAESGQQEQQLGGGLTVVWAKPGSRLFTFPGQSQQLQGQWTPITRPFIPLNLPGLFDDHQWGQWAAVQMQAIDPSRSLFGHQRRWPCPHRQAMMATLAEAEHAAPLAQEQQAGSESAALESLAQWVQEVRESMLEDVVPEGAVAQPVQGPDEEGEEQSGEETRALATEQELAAFLPEEGDQPALRTEEHFAEMPAWEERLVDQDASMARVASAGMPQGAPPRRDDPAGSNMLDYCVSGLLFAACFMVWARAVVGFYTWREEMRACSDMAVSEPLLSPLSPEKPLGKSAAMLAPIEVAKDNVVDGGKYVEFVYVPLKGSA